MVELARIVWVYASYPRNIEHLDLFDKFEGEIVKKGKELTGKDLSMVFWSCVRKVTLGNSTFGFLIEKYLWLVY